MPWIWAAQKERQPKLPAFVIRNIQSPPQAYAQRVPLQLPAGENKRRHSRLSFSPQKLIRRPIRRRAYDAQTTRIHFQWIPPHEN